MGTAGSLPRVLPLCRSSLGKRPVSRQHSPHSLTCVGLNPVPQKTPSSPDPPKPVNSTLFGNSVVADVIMLTRGHGTGVLMREGNRDAEKHGERPQRRLRLEESGHKPRDLRIAGEPRSWEGQEGPSPGASRGSAARPHLAFYFWLPERREKKSLGKLPACGTAMWSRSSRGRCWNPRLPSFCV